MTVSPHVHTRTYRSREERVYQLEDVPPRRPHVDWSNPTLDELDQLPAHIRRQAMEAIRQDRWHEPVLSDIAGLNYCTEVQL